MNYTMADYVSARAANDYPNAIAIWDALSEEIADHICRNSEVSYNPALPAIFSSFMPKAGGTFLHNRLMKTVGYLDFYWAVTHEASAAQVYPVPRAVEVYKRGGYTCHTHATPSPFFRMIMEPVVKTPIWVHIRHPAEACLAGFFHFQGEGQGEGAVHEQRVAEIEKDKQVLREMHGYTFNEPWPQFFAMHCEFYVAWLEAWLQYAEEQPHRVHFTYFDELSDAAGMLMRVFARYGHHLRIDSVAQLMSEDRRRTGGTRDWRAELDDGAARQIARADAVWDRAISLRPASPAAS